MQSKKQIDSTGKTTHIILKKDSGAYNVFTPREAAQAINELKRQLWSGIPQTREFTTGN